MAACRANGPGPAAQPLLHQRQRFGDLALVPAAAVLVLERHQIAGAIQTGVAPRVLQQHERQQRGGFRGGRALGPVNARTSRPRRMASAHRLGAQREFRAWPHSPR